MKKTTVRKTPGIKSRRNMVININIVGDKDIKVLNNKYFERNYPTDVLSFNFNQVVDGEYYLGDVVVNKDQAERQCKDYGNDLEHEISELVAHGVLHLLGVHHEDDNDNRVHGVTT